MAQAIDEATTAYFVQRGWIFNFGDLWSCKPPSNRSIRKDPDGWVARVYNGPKSGRVCTAPDPITCFITAELMNWSSPDV